MQWLLESQDIPKNQEELKKILLSNRKISDSTNFFNPTPPSELSLEELGFDAARSAQAVAVILQAVADKKDIVIFGDYDADGICATAVLWEGLQSLGCVARPFIPHREKHGYGVTKKAVEEISAAKRPDLIITVDNGIVAHAAAAFARTAGIPLVISDHHQAETNPAGELLYPEAAGIFHTTLLCGTTVAWMLARELGAPNMQESLDLCGLATISDQVPLVGANRVFAKYGVEALRRTTRVGLQALYTEAGVRQAELDSYSVGFTVAPRINAMGRLSHGMDALRLLCTKSNERAAQLASILGQTNIQRQDITLDQFNAAVAQVSIQVEESIVVAHSPEFHEGIIGLIAGRLVEKYAKPALVMSVGEKGIKGSARSVKGVNITELLRSVREHLTEVGGHPMAGGFSVTHEKLTVFKSSIFAAAKKTIRKELLIPSLVLDCQLPLSLISEAVCLMIEEFAPFGSNNQKPIFSLGKVRIVGKQTMGKEKQHLKFLIEPTDFSTAPIEGLWWRKGGLEEHFSVGQVVTCAGYLECSSWNGKKKMQVVVKDVQN
jgi:single-stranded-DNA-specific exonuclease